jgi:flagellar biosynthesis/type III secretory pathway protein FliH
MAFADLKNDFIFRHIEVPADLAPGPYGAALELANQAKFTAAELQAYEKARDEIRQVLEIAAARWAEGLAEGEIKGFAKGETAGVVKGKVEGKVEAILAVLAARGVPMSHEVRARISACTDAATLDRWIVRAVTAASAEEILSEHA